MRALLIALLCAAPASAAVIGVDFVDQGDDFLDAETGLVWRKPSRAVFNGGQALLDSGLFPEYRFATVSELEELFDNFDVDTSGSNTSYAEALLNMLGSTTGGGVLWQSKGWIPNGPLPDTVAEGLVEFLIDPPIVTRVTTNLEGTRAYDDWLQPYESSFLADDWGAWIVRVPEMSTGQTMFVAVMQLAGIVASVSLRRWLVARRGHALALQTAAPHPAGR